MRITGKKILLGITGSISAYKAADLCRLLVKEGATVKVVMTKSAANFITPLTLATLSKNPVQIEMISSDDTWNNHVELGLWADLLVVAPASANTIAHFANGICETLLDAVFLSSRCPVMIAPAMDHDMFLHNATQQNLKLLKERNNLIINPANGELASGLIGEGRLQEPQFILDVIANYFNDHLPLKGRKILLTAGPTRESIDPVRYITNHSTGKMGIAIAEVLLNNGAEVHLVAGPLQIPIPSEVHKYNVNSASEMLAVCLNLFPSMHAGILSAAVADYTPAIVANEKVKKKDDEWNLSLKKTVDIASELGKMKTKNQLLVGFALETNNEVENAKEKLKKKNLDFIVLNSLQDEGAGFGTNTNKITILDNNNIIDFPLKSKHDVACDIVSKLIELINA